MRISKNPAFSSVAVDSLRPPPGFEEKVKRLFCSESSVLSHMELRPMGLPLKHPCSVLAQQHETLGWSLQNPPK